MSTTSLKGETIVELARAIAALARDDVDDFKQIVASVHKVWSRQEQTALPGIEPGAARTNTDGLRKEAAVRLFRYWQKATEHAQAKLTPERATAIAARLRDGYSEAEIRKAIDGAAAAPYVDKESGKRYDDLTLICRNGSKLESFMERGVTATGEIAAEVTVASPVEEQISALRREMADMRKTGRDTEYSQAAERLRVLMQGRKAT